MKSANSNSPRTETVMGNGMDFKPHGTFLTREKTMADTFPRSKSKKKKKEPKFRMAKLQLDVLTAGDIFVSYLYFCDESKYQNVMKLSQLFSLKDTRW